jgi:hypothetical protein
MRLACLSVLAASLMVCAMTAPAASAQERHSCGNYGYPEGYSGEDPIFTSKPIVGAGVENIRTRAIGCRRGRRMVKAFWNDRFVCNAKGTRCTYGTYRCGNRRLGEELWLMRCFDSRDRDRMLKFRFGA